MEQHVFFKEVDVIGNPALPTAANHTGFITDGGHAFNALFSIHAGQRVMARISAVSDTRANHGVWVRI